MSGKMLPLATCQCGKRWATDLELVLSPAPLVPPGRVAPIRQERMRSVIACPQCGRSDRVVRIHLLP